MKKRILWSFLFPCLAAAALVPEAYADWKFTFTPTFSAGLEYDSNIFTSSSNEQDDFNYQGTAFFPFRAESEETTIGLNYRTSRFQYFSESEADYGNHFINLTAGHNVTRRLRLYLADTYSVTKDSDRILRSETEEGETGIIAERVRRESNSATGSATYALSPRTSVSLSATNAYYEYSRASYYDSSSNGGSLSLSYQINPQNTLTTGFSFRRTDYDRSDREFTENSAFTLAEFNLFLGPIYRPEFSKEFDQALNYASYVGWTRHFSETLDATISVGARWTEDTLEQPYLISSPGSSVALPHSLPSGSLVRPVINGSPGPLVLAVSGERITIPNAVIATTDDSEKDSGLNLNLNVRKQFRGSSLTVGFSQDTFDRVAFGGTSVRQSYTANYTRRHSDLWNSFLNLRYSQNEEDSDRFEDQFNTLRVGIGTRYKITRNLESSLSWTRSVQTRETKDEGGSRNQPRTERDVAGLLFTYAWPLVR